MGDGIAENNGGKKMSDIIQVEKLTMEEAREDYSKLFLTYKEMLVCSDVEAAIAVSITVGTCSHCLESPVGCQCWNDE